MAAGLLLHTGLFSGGNILLKRLKTIFSHTHIVVVGGGGSFIPLTTSGFYKQTREDRRPRPDYSGDFRFKGWAEGFTRRRAEPSRHHTLPVSVLLLQQFHPICVRPLSNIYKYGTYKLPSLSSRLLL